MGKRGVDIHVMPNSKERCCLSAAGAGTYEEVIFDVARSPRFEA